MKTDTKGERKKAQHRFSWIIFWQMQFYFIYWLRLQNGNSAEAVQRNILLRHSWAIDSLPLPVTRQEFCLPNLPLPFLSEIRVKIYKFAFIFIASTGWYLSTLFQCLQQPFSSLIKFLTNQNCLDPILLLNVIISSPAIKASLWSLILLINQQLLLNAFCALIKKAN